MGWGLIRGELGELVRESIWFNILGARLVSEGELEMSKEQASVGLTGIQPFS